jgi:hypothetical protein
VAYVETRPKPGDAGELGCNSSASGQCGSDMCWSAGCIL